MAAGAQLEKPYPRTVDDIRRAVERIRSIADDDERAHVWEDDLHQVILAAIAAGDCPNPAEWAAEALKTRDIEFCRWCA